VLGIFGAALPFEPEENETVLWEGSAVFTTRLLYVTIFATVLLASGTVLAATGRSGIGVAFMLLSSWFFLIGLLHLIARGSHYYVTSRRIVREKFPIYQELSLQEITHVRPSMFGLFGLWGIYFYSLVPDETQPVSKSVIGKEKRGMLPYRVIFSFLNKEDPGKIKRIVEEARQGFTTSGS
jgi:hypothetical protein